MCQCKYCGFKNPDDINSCLNCKKTVPISRKEFDKNVETLKGAVNGDWEKVAGKLEDKASNHWG
jgi:hypothetical protein